MLTHGTRSAYNRGCRCDECRETARLARARQRAAAAEGEGVSPVSFDPSNPTDWSVSPWWLVVGLSAAAVGGWSLWRSWKVDPDQEGAPQLRRRRTLAGLAFVATGLGVLAFGCLVEDY